MIASVRAALLPLAVATLTLAIFIVDAFTPIDIAIAVLYGAVILLAAQEFSRRAVILLALVCVGLTLTAYGIGHHNAFSKGALSRCLVSLAAITIITSLALKWHRATRLLLEREQELHQADRHKDEFLATLAHELRNPLAAIHSAVQLLKTSQVSSEPVSELHALLVRQTAHLSNLAEDLLDVSRVRQGLVRLHMETVDMKQVIAEAVEQAMPLIDSKRQRLTVHLPKAAVVLSGDHKRLVQVIANLLNNAARYTSDDGQIILEMHADDTQVKMSVTDNGIGIDPALLPHVFDLFAQAERTLDRAEGGLGLGLALVKSITGLLGGDVAVFSEGAGKGTCVTVALPLKSLTANPQAEFSLPPTHGSIRKPLRLMLVDDNEDFAEMLAVLLRSEGHEVMVETDPHAALLKARQCSPQICIVDIALPGMNGYALVAEIRMVPQTKDAIVIALTGYEQAQDKALAQGAGFDHYLVKTVNTQKLVEDLLQILDKNASFYLTDDGQTPVKAV